MTNPEDDALLLVASSVADGNSVVWSEVASSAAIAGDEALVRELDAIARIGAFHRKAAGADIPNDDDRTGHSWARLEILERLGAGSFGTVYRARDQRLQRDVALKIYRTHGLASQQLTALFSEGRLLARVRHPNVVLVHGIEEHADEVGLSLELVDGRTLAQEVAAGGPLGFREAALIGQDLCRALSAVHNEGLVHRDIKPQNVMRERGGRIVLMDFGIGRDLRASHDGGSNVGGTPLYMAPEVFSGAAPSVASDIYSLGVLLFYLVTGTHPVVAATRTELAHAHRDGRRRLVRDLRPELPDAFVEVIDRACAVDPTQRYATAGAMHGALATVLGVSSETTSFQAASRSTQFRGARWALASAVLIAAAAVVFIMTRQRETPQTSNPIVAVAPVSTNPSPAPVPADPEEYRIRAVFHRAVGTGSEPLQGNARVRPGDRLFLEIEATRSLHLYVVNQDERGESYLLFPLPGQALKNPLAAGTTHRLPGRVDWEVTSAGGREHFLVVASPEPLMALEKVFTQLPAPQIGGPAPAALSREAIGQLRGIGGLSPRATAGAATDLLRSAAALGGHETVKGPWMRQFTLENPGR